MSGSVRTSKEDRAPRKTRFDGRAIDSKKTKPPKWERDAQQRTMNRPDAQTTRLTDSRSLFTIPIAHSRPERAAAPRQTRQIVRSADCVPKYPKALSVSCSPLSSQKAPKGLHVHQCRAQYAGFSGDGRRTQKPFVLVDHVYACRSRGPDRQRAGNSRSAICGCEQRVSC